MGQTRMLASIRARPSRTWFAYYVDSFDGEIQLLADARKPQTPMSPPFGSSDPAAPIPLADRRPPAPLEDAAEPLEAADSANTSETQADATALFSAVLERLRPRVSGFVLHGFFEPLVALSLDEDALVLGAPSPFHRDWIRDHYTAELTAELRGLTGLGIAVRVEHDPAAPVISLEPDLSDPALALQSVPATFPASGPTNAPPRRPAAAPSAAPVVPLASRRPQATNNSRPLNSRYTFDSFITGPSNRMAFAACRAVADAPAQTYSPLFLFGGVGLGKTHLLHAIGHAAMATHPGMRVVYMSAEEWVNEYIHEIRNQRFDAFRARYRGGCDLLLIDDIQFLAGKDASQDEFFHTFNSLHERHRQIVVTSDRYPHQIEGLEERLQTRLGWGLIADVQPPELETRVAILLHKADALGIDFDEDTAHYLATRICSSVRELEGALVRLKAFATLTHEPITLAFAKEQLGPILAGQKTGLTLERILQSVAAYFDLRPAQLLGKGRQRQVSRARQLTMYLARLHLGMSLPELGRAFGGRDHTTVLSSVRKIESLAHTDAGVAAVLSRLETSLL